MSLNINFANIDADVALSAQTFLNNKFLAAEKPDFIGHISISDLSFGDIPPEIEILDITDPFDEFYLPESDSESLDSSSHSSFSSTRFQQQFHPHHRSSSQTHASLKPRANSLPASQENITTSNTQSPSIPSVSSFHRTHHHESHHRSSSDSFNTKPPQSQHNPYFDAHPHSHSLPLQKSPNDIQFHIHISYTGNISMKISTELILNQPTPKFMSIPIELTLRGCKFDGIGVVSILNGERIHFCFLESEDEAGNTSLLQDVTFESSIGDKTHQVLKNVSKLEKFIKDQIHKFLDQECIWPNYYAVILQK
ncbi:hypothetical protein BKA69DRAFT_1123266 [Paraphysoderma sedebokerense]|nr:hypothetical protein BKA69DRAFT_1123266 [Paraphysoderma sedebokerense]